MQSLVDSTISRLRSHNTGLAGGWMMLTQWTAAAPFLRRASGTPNENGDDDAKSDSAKKGGGSSDAEKRKKDSAAANSKDSATGGDGGGSSNNNNNNGDNEDSGDSTTPKADEGEAAVNSFLRRVTMLVASITVAALGAWYWSFPTGRHLSWTELYSRAASIQSIEVFNQYAQVALDNEYAYVGVRPDSAGTEITDEQVRHILSMREADAERVQISFMGTPMGQRLLRFIEVWSFVVPFVFFPLFTLVVSRAAASIVYDNAKFTTAIGNRREAILSSAAEQFQIAKKTNTRFRDIAGMTEAKGEIVEIVDFLKHPERYTAMGAKIPAGALLLGVPGTGKTLLAKAVAGESDTPFIACCGSDFVELYAGMGALRVRKLFELAKTQKKCIIYIDEIDAIGGKRSGSGMGEASEQEHTLNEMLTQLDGFNKEKDRIIVLASTNADKEMLDPALIRPGRFDRVINVEAPVLSERIVLFETYIKTLRLVPPTAEEKAAALLLAAGDAATATAAAAADVAKSSSTDAPVSDKVAEAPAAEVAATPAALSTTAAAVGAPAAPVVAAADASAASPCTVVIAVKPEEPGTPTPEKKSTIAVSSGTTASNVVPDTLSNAVALTDDTGSHDNGSSNAKSDAAKQEDESQAVDDKQRAKKFPNPDTAEMRATIASMAQRMSSLCPGFVGADIASVCNEAAILAARERCDVVNISHLERSIDRVLAGIEHRSRVLSEREKEIVAHHEAGHAVAGWFLGRADPLMKVSIVPRGGKALGYAQYLPAENQLRTSAEIEDSICVTLGGRVAEHIFFDHLSTGASDDLQKVRRMAYMHAASFGRTTAVVSPGSSATRYSKPYGTVTEKEIDDSAKALVDRMYQRTLDLLQTHKDLMKQLAAHLLKHEVLTHADIIQYMGERMQRPSDKASIF